MQYTVLYSVLLILVLGVFVRYTDESSQFSRNNVWAYCLLTFMVLIIGVRDWSSPLFGDSKAYGKYFSLASAPNSVWYSSSKFFGYLYYYWNLSGLSPELFFVVSASFYCLPMYYVSKRFSAPYSPYVFLLFFACSFGWYSFGVNGIRNGWAFATMMWALLAYYNHKLILGIALLVVAWCIHGSSMIPIGGMIAAYLYGKPDKSMIIWVACVFCSLIFGRVAQDYFATIDFIADDGGGYLTGSMENNVVGFSHTGFRWDFLLFSLAPILWGLYCIKQNHRCGKADLFYSFLLCTYIYANAVWVLAIRAAYSNRLAQTSWWLIPIVMAYPLFRMDIFSNRCKMAACLLIGYYSFTFFMYLV